MYLLFVENDDGNEPGDYIGCTLSYKKACRIVLETTLPYAYKKRPVNVPFPGHRNVRALKAVPLEENIQRAEEDLIIAEGDASRLMTMAGEAEDLQQLVSAYLDRKKKHDDACKESSLRDQAT